MQIDRNNYGTMLFMSKQVSLPKISSILQKMKIGQKSDIRPFCTKAFNYPSSWLLKNFLISLRNTKEKLGNVLREGNTFRADFWIEGNYSAKDVVVHVLTTCIVHSFNCWRALARQLPILYNREKKVKFVGCKIGDLRSKFAFNIRGLLNVETCAVDYGCLWMHVELSIHFKRKEGQDKGGEFLHLCR